jgi:hypothetical protein
VSSTQPAPTRRIAIQGVQTGTSWRPARAQSVSPPARRRAPQSRSPPAVVRNASRCDAPPLSRRRSGRSRAVCRRSGRQSAPVTARRARWQLPTSPSVSHCCSLTVIRSANTSGLRARSRRSTGSTAGASRARCCPLRHFWSAQVAAATLGPWQSVRARAARHALSYRSDRAQAGRKSGRISRPSGARISSARCARVAQLRRRRASQPAAADAQAAQLVREAVRAM